MLSRLFNAFVRLSVFGYPKEEVHLSRYLQYKSLANCDLQNIAGKKRIASISGSERLCKIIGFEDSRIDRLDYPEYDARRLPVSDSHYSVSIADQVAEHIDSEPGMLFREMARIVEPGGYFVNATVMTYPVHFGPKDMWRFTPEGHEFLFTSNGFEVVFSGCWGGASNVHLVASGNALLRVPKWQKHPIHRLAETDDPRWPIVIWAIGRNIKDNENVKTDG